MRGLTDVVLKSANFSSRGNQTLPDVYLLFQVRSGPVWVEARTIKAKPKDSSALIIGDLVPGSDITDSHGKSFVDGEVAELRLQFRVPGYDVELVYEYDGAYLATAAPCRNPGRGPDRTAACGSVPRGRGIGPNPGQRRLAPMA